MSAAGGHEPAAALGTVGFVGLGAMGFQLARQALAAGVEVLVHDLDPDRVETVVGLGATPGGSVPEMARSCAWLVTSLPTVEALRAVVADAATAPGPGLLGVIETSTFSVTDKEEAAHELAKAGLDLVDCPLSGTSFQAALGDLIAYVSGSESGCAAAVPVVETFTRAHYLLGRLGNGTRMKLVANHLVAIHNAAAAEALLLAALGGLDLDTVLRAVGDGAGSSRMLQVRGPLIARSDYTATMRVDNFMKDIDIIRDHASTLGAPTPLLDETAELYRDLLDSGHGELDTAAVYLELARQVVADRAAASEQAGQS